MSYTTHCTYISGSLPSFLPSFFPPPPSSLFLSPPSLRPYVFLPLPPPSPPLRLLRLLCLCLCPTIDRSMSSINRLDIL